MMPRSSQVAHFSSSFWFGLARTKVNVATNLLRVSDLARRETLVIITRNHILIGWSMWNIFLPFRACTLFYLTVIEKVFSLEIMYKIVIDPIARV